MAKKTAIGGVLTACALIFSYVEYLVPVNIGFPGIKLGLANIVIIVALYRLGTTYALIINVTRIFIAALLFSGMMGMLFGLSGGVLSIIIMAQLKRADVFSVVGISIAGGVCHNIGQLLIAWALIANFAVLYYLPVLLFFGAITGLCIGLLSRILIERI
jgi:heptaprenyl diphosphate synthase